MKQQIITAKDDYSELDRWIEENGCGKILMVCDDSVKYMTSFGRHLDALDGTSVRIIRFSDFKPNPLYESVVKGVELFRENGCDGIMAIGGGSAIDVAKCIKLYGKMTGGSGGGFLSQTIIPNDVPFLAMPTTAGTGSEATRYAVIYYNNEKQSITDCSMIPQTVLMDPGALVTLPPYQKKATMMDALCHAIESFWSVNSTEESMCHSREAIRLVMKHMDAYLANSEDGCAGMLKAANEAGKAINISQTTAGHAMSYKITGMFGAAHGHAVILCDRVLFPWMTENIDRCTDPRGKEHLRNVLRQTADAMGCPDEYAAAGKLNDIFRELGFEIPTASEEQFAILKGSVNTVRLKNHPIALDEDTIDFLYHKILNGDRI